MTNEQIRAMRNLYGIVDRCLCDAELLFDSSDGQVLHHGKRCEMELVGLHPGPTISLEDQPRDNVVRAEVPHGWSIWKRRTE